MKNERQAIILKLIAENEIHTQEELTERLKENNISVTQATVSRDIRELKLLKIMSENGTYKYSAPGPNDDIFDERLVDIFKRVVIKVQYVGFMICIQTVRGMANAAAVSIDASLSNDIIGSVAGDDTVFVLVANEAKAAELVKDFKKILSW